MMEKRVLIQTKTEDGIFLYNLDSRIDSGHLVKTAAVYHPDIASYIRTAQPIPGKLQVLVIAMGAGEFYGSNKNGDFFTEEGLKHEGTDYGYKTFETHAKVFKNHVNQPDSPSYGTVRLAVWNDQMKRVELVLLIDREKAPDLCERIESGEYPDVSMGTTVPFDICSICGNKAPTRKQYCEHAKFYMNRVPPGHSKKAYVINTLPKFFDISFVIIGADSIAKTILKVASFAVPGGPNANHDAFPAGAQATGRFHKHASKRDEPRWTSKKLSDLAKAAVMDKEVPSNLDGNIAAHIPAAPGEVEIPDEQVQDLVEATLPALRAREKPISRHVIIKITGGGEPGLPMLSRIFSTLLGMGIAPQPAEFQDIALRGMGQCRLADHMDARGLLFDEGGLIPPRTQEYVDRHFRIDPDNFDPHICDELLPMFHNRSFMRPALAGRMLGVLSGGPVVRKTIMLRVIPAEDVQGAIAKQGGAASYPELEDDSGGMVGPLSSLLLLAGIYAALRKGQASPAMSRLERAALSHPGLAALAVGGGAAGMQALTHETVHGQSDIDPETGMTYRPLSIQEFLESRNAAPLHKAGSLTTRALIGVPAIYMASGIKEVQHAKNPYEEEGRLSGVVRKYPSLLATGLIGEHLVGRPIASRLEGVPQALQEGYEKLPEIKKKFMEGLRGVPPSAAAAAEGSAAATGFGNIAKRLGRKILTKGASASSGLDLLRAQPQLGTLECMTASDKEILEGAVEIIRKELS